MQQGASATTGYLLLALLMGVGGLLVWQELK